MTDGAVDDGVSHAGDCWGVYDDASVRDLRDGAEQQLVLRSCVTLANNVTQVGTAKAGDVSVRIAQAELLDDVVANALGGAGGEGGDGTIGEEFAEAAKLPIFGAEVMAPFGDAMCFVDGEK